MLFDRLAPEGVVVVVRAVHAYWLNHHRFPAILHPRSFTEKVLFRRMFDRRPIFRLFADKYEVRDFVRQRVGERYLSEVFYIGNRPTELPFDRFPQQFVVKPTHGSGWVRLVTDGAAADRAAIRRECESWLARSYYRYSREWNYRDVEPRIMVEEYLTDGSGSTPPDYKLFVFDGRVQMIEVHFDRFGDHRYNAYDSDWNRLDVGKIVDRKAVGRGPEHQPKPDNLSEIIGVAEALAADLDFLRVDLYNLNGRIVFGELTPMPGGGFDPFVPESFDYQLGALWQLRRPSLLPG